MGIVDLVRAIVGPDPPRSSCRAWEQYRQDLLKISARMCPEIQIRNGEGIAPNELGCYFPTLRNWFTNAECRELRRQRLHKLGAKDGESWSWQIKDDTFVRRC